MKNKKYWLIGSGSSSCRRMTADLENVQIHDFEKVKFLMILDDLNKYRVDAHAKDIDETDFKQIRIYFDKLESLLES